MVEKVQGFGGVILQRSPWLLTAAMGLPQALDQMPLRAVQAALAIRQLVLERRQPSDGAPRPEIRQAVHVGSVLVGMEASDITPQLLPVGETLALPLRLLGHAAPGEILISPRVGRQVQATFELQPRRLLLDGTTGEEIPAFSLARPRPSPLTAGMAHGHRPFVRRTRELGVLRDALGQVEGGRGQVVAMVGDAGVGKSRLLAEFYHQVAASRVTYVAGHCFSYDQAMPYLPILEILRQQCGITEADAPETIAQKVRVSLAATAMEPETTAPYLFHLLGLPAERDRLVDLGPQETKTRTFDALCQLTLHACRQRLLLVVVEDLHWSDKTSEEYLTGLVERLSGAPILLLATYRPGYRPSWLEKSYATQLALQPLSPHDSFSLLQSVLPASQVSDRLKRAILAKAEGNPFFLEELAQAVVEHGDRRGIPDLPDTIQGVLRARIDRLPEAPKRLLQTMAVIGYACPLRLLTQVVHSPPDQLQPLLSSLQHGEFLYEEPSVPELEYRLKHALTQDVAYQALPLEERRGLHEHVAQAIEKVFAGRLEEHYGALAHHYRRSGNTAQAVTYLGLAGKQAAHQSAYGDAISHLTTALELLQTLPDTLERRQQELVLQTTLGAALMVTKGYAASDVEHAYARARELCQQLGDTRQLLPVLFGLWTFSHNRAAYQTARELGEQLLDLAQRQADQGALLQAHRALGTTLSLLAEVAAARVHLEQGITGEAPPQSQVSSFLYGQDPRVTCLSYLARALWLLGYPDQALHRSHEAVALARQLSHPASLAFALYFAALVQRYRRDAPAAQELAEAVLALADTHGFLLRRAQGMSVRGWALVEQGQVEEGMGQLRDSRAAYQATGTQAGQARWLVLAEAYGNAGQVDAGLRVLAEAFTTVHNSGERAWEAEQYRLQGELILRMREGENEGEREGGEIPPSLPPSVPLSSPEECFCQALDVARRQQVKSLELRAAMSLTRLWQQQGKRQEGRRLLAQIYGWFTEGFDTPDLQEAKALLDSLSHSAPRP